MTKTLTEQWKDGELKSGMFYLKMTDTDGSISRDEYFHPCGFVNWLPEDIKEVLAPVPSYDEYQGLLSDQLAKNEATEINAELEHKVELLQEQLNEANEVILGLHKPYGTSLEPATIYLDKWGVK